MAERRRATWEFSIDGERRRLEAHTWRQVGDEFQFYNRLDGGAEEEVARFEGIGRGNIRKVREP